MMRIFFIACMLATWVAVANGTRYHLYAELDSPFLFPPSPNSLSPSPSSECSTLIYNMASCLPFLSDGDIETKPDSSCCSGFNSVVKANAECICEAVRSSSDLGVNLNSTKVVTLFSACGISSPPISNCSIAPPPPGSSPVEPPVSPSNKSPTLSPSNPFAAPVPSSSGETPAPSSDNNGNQAPAPSAGEAPAPSTDNRGNQAPTPSPQAHGGAYTTTSVSFTVVIISMFIASFSIISV